MNSEPPTCAKASALTQKAARGMVEAWQSEGGPFLHVNEAMLSSLHGAKSPGWFAGGGLQSESKEALNGSHVAMLEQAAMAAESTGMPPDPSTLSQLLPHLSHP